MKVNHHLDVPSEPVVMEGASGCRVRWLVGKSEGAPNFAMRQFEISPGGFTPRHSHPYEHEVFVLEGTGVVLENDIEHRLQAGDVIYVAPNEVHQFRNTGRTPMTFLCLVPHVPEGTPVTVAPECGAEPAARCC
jgi:quercetin dioxygenase-like cupin family protein